RAPDVDGPEGLPAANLFDVKRSFLLVDGVYVSVELAYVVGRIGIAIDQQSRRDRQLRRSGFRPNPAHRSAYGWQHPVYIRVKIPGVSARGSLKSATIGPEARSVAEPSHQARPLAGRECTMVPVDVNQKSGPGRTGNIVQFVREK